MSSERAEKGHEVVLLAVGEADLEPMIVRPDDVASVAAEPSWK